MPRLMTRLAIGVCAAACLTACGGGKHGSTAPSNDGAAASRGGAGDGEAMVSPDAMDEIQRLFRRKGTAVSRCLSLAIDGGELPKASRGKITLGLTIAPNGHAGDVKVLKASLESKLLSECVIHKVEEIQFPELPKPYETTYTYAFEAT